MERQVKSRKIVTSKPQVQGSYQISTRPTLDELISPELCVHISLKATKDKTAIIIIIIIIIIYYL